MSEMLSVATHHIDFSYSLSRLLVPNFLLCLLTAHTLPPWGSFILHLHSHLLAHSFIFLQNNNAGRLLYSNHNEKAKTKNQIKIQNSKPCTQIFLLKKKQSFIEEGKEASLRRGHEGQDFAEEMTQAPEKENNLLKHLAGVG